MKEIENLKKDYEGISIPKELEFTVRKAIQRTGRRRRLLAAGKGFASIAAGICIVFIGTVNISPTAANAMAKVQGLRSLVELVSFRELTYEDEHHEVDIQIPKVEGLEDKELEASINEKYLEENTKLYEDFMKSIDNQEVTSANLALFKQYEILVQTDDFMVIKSTKTEIAASGAESVTFVNLDLKNQQAISLPSLFTDDSYIDVISNYIISEMKAQMKDGELMYFLAENGDIGGFEKIKAEQPFYIDAEGQLVISFDEYEVAPGYMGVIEFKIPTEVIQSILVSNTYVKNVSR